MKIAFHAFDVGPGHNHALVALEAALRNHAVTMQVGGSCGALDLLAAKPDVLVTAVSSFKGGEEEVPIGLRAVEHGIPWVVFTDVHEAWRRPSVKDHASKVAAVLVAHPDEIGLAQKEWGYPRAECLGYPPTWGRFLRTVPKGDSVRARITKSKDDGEAAALANDDVVVLICGGKDPKLNNELLAGAIEAGRKLYGERFVVAPRLHPRENEPTSEERQAREEFFAGVWKAETAAFKSVESLVTGVNFTVATAGATIIIYAALLRRPVIHYDARRVEELNLQQVGKVGWFPVDHGAAAIASGVDGIVSAMERLATTDGMAELTAKQSALYPDVEIQMAIEQPSEGAIISFLEREFSAKK